MRAHREATHRMRQTPSAGTRLTRATVVADTVPLNGLYEPADVNRRAGATSNNGGVSDRCSVLPPSTGRH